MSDLKITLEALHRCEREVDVLSKEAARLPEAIATARAKSEAARDAVEAERQKLAEAEHLRREKEAELADAEAKRQKYEGQTALVKTNEEYTALLREIENEKRRISEFEEEILLAMESADEVSGRLDDFTRERKREEEGFSQKANTLESRLKQVESDREEREAEREALAAQLPASAQGHYKRVHASVGAGTANVQKNVCGACHRDVPYETLNRVAAGELLTCLSCNRVIVVVEE